MKKHNLNLDSTLLATLIEIKNSRSASKAEVYRSEIILYFHKNKSSFKAGAKDLGFDRKTISLWFKRGKTINECWKDNIKNRLSEPGYAGENLRNLRLLKELLADNPRTGAPPIYSHEIYTQIVAIAVRNPKEFGYPISHWSARELCEVVHKEEISNTISERQVSRFLKEGDLKPHKVEYWLNPKIDDEDIFRKEVKKICDLYADTQRLNKEGVHIISTDEKTGIQALERIAETKPMKSGIVERQEAEYIRHGSLCLMPAFDIAKGKIVETYIGETRNEEDFTKHIKNTISADPEGEWIFVCDNLNTHMSESLVKLIASLINCQEDLGIKRKRGILKSMESRKDFLQDENHTICFLYTPKHCSWLNQIEIWFGILSRKLLKRGEFKSKKDLKTQMLEFIEYFNKAMAKPFKWIYKGVPLSV